MKFKYNKIFLQKYNKNGNKLKYALKYDILQWQDNI